MLAEKLKDEPGFGRPKIITLCGSTRFKPEFLDQQRRLSLDGVIVLTVGFYHHADAVPITAAQKKELDELHFRKIEMSDEVFVVNPGGYVGESTRNEIAHAIAYGKKIRFLDEKLGDDYLKRNSHELGRLAAEKLVR